MHWSYERSAYQVADVDGRAVLYGEQSDGMSLRGQAFDLTADELAQSLRMGGFRLTDVAATPEGQTPFIGDFRAINGNRQLVGLALVAAVLGTGPTKRVVAEGSIFDRAQGEMPRADFLHEIAVSDESE